MIRLSWFFAILKTDSQLKNSFPKMSLRTQEKSIFHLNGKSQHRNWPSLWLSRKDKSLFKKKKEEEEAVSTDSHSRKLSYKIELERFSSPGNEIQMGGGGGGGNYTYFTGLELLDLLSNMLTTSHMWLFKFTFKLVMFLEL